MNWMRAIGGGVLAEVLLIVVLMPVVFIIVAGSFVMPALVTQWVAKRAPSRLVLHGLLVGFSAFVVYATPMILTGQHQPPLYWVAHAMKILGGLAGGFVAARRQATRGTAVTV
jgi:hypothetical protein